MKSNKKKNKKLRREVEVLRAQLKTTNVPNDVTSTKLTGTKKVKNTAYIDVDDKYIKKDLLKSIVLAFIGSGIIIGIWYLQLF